MDEKSDHILRGLDTPPPLKEQFSSDIYSNVSVCHVVRPPLLGRYCNACNTTENQNTMQQSDLVLEKYWVTHSGYFRLAPTVALGMGITDGKLLYCHGVAEGNVDKKVSTLEHNNRTVYDCFNNPFIDEFGSPDLHLPLITIDDGPRLHKEPTTPRICSQMPSLMPLKIMLELLLPVLILQIYFLLMIIILSMV